MDEHSDDRTVERSPLRLLLGVLAVAGAVVLQFYKGQWSGDPLPTTWRIALWVVTIAGIYGGVWLIVRGLGRREDLNLDPF